MADWPLDTEQVRTWARDGYATGAHAQAYDTARAKGVHTPVAVMPDAHLGKGACIGTVVATEGTIIPSCVGVDLGCFVGETRVPLLDGTQLTLKAMAESGDVYWVYSIDSSGKIVPGKAVALQTRQDAELVRVTVAGGDEIVCTPDHEFMLRDGSYRQADDLKFNDSLMPLYRSWQARDGYESVGCGNKMRMTHLLAYRESQGRIPEGMIVHHINGNHFDNRPGNLTLMARSEHSRHHRRVGHKFDNSDPAFQVARRKGIRKYSETAEGRARQVEVGVRNITKYMNERPEHYKEAVKDNGKRGAAFLRKFNTSPRACGECDHVATNPAALRWHKKKTHATNHKVMSVVRLQERAAVYCLQVEDHHNFAISAGVFVHNCGMSATKLDVTAHQLPDTLEGLLSLFSQNIPAINQNDPYSSRLRRLDKKLGPAPSGRADMAKAGRQVGTLGSGNHFLEVSLDPEDYVWVVVHSGSRGVGNKLAQAHIKIAERLDAAASKDLAAFTANTAEFDAYIADMQWAQQYAFLNREEMLNAAIRVFERYIGVKGTVQVVDEVKCHHNYATKEVHSGKEMWITRKGAIRARVGDRGIIPGSMGTSTFIVRGLGNPASYQSAAHGAGRVMSRNQAKIRLSLDDLHQQMEGRVWLKDRAHKLLDEAPDAYKDINDVMAWQADLCEVETELTAVLNYKGA